MLFHFFAICREGEAFSVMETLLFSRVSETRFTKRELPAGMSKRPNREQCPNLLLASMLDRIFGDFFSTFIVWDSANGHWYLSDNDIFHFISNEY